MITYPAEQLPISATTSAIPWVCNILGYESAFIVNSTNVVSVSADSGLVLSGGYLTAIPQAQYSGGAIVFSSSGQIVTNVRDGYIVTYSAGSAMYAYTSGSQILITSDNSSLYPAGGAAAQLLYSGAVLLLGVSGSFSGGLLDLPSGGNLALSGGSFYDSNIIIDMDCQADTVLYGGSYGITCDASNASVFIRKNGDVTPTVLEASYNLSGATISATDANVVISSGVWYGDVPPYVVAELTGPQHGSGGRYFEHAIRYTMSSGGNTYTLGAAVVSAGMIQSTIAAGLFVSASGGVLSLGNSAIIRGLTYVSGSVYPVYSGGASVSAGANTTLELRGLGANTLIGDNITIDSGSVVVPTLSGYFVQKSSWMNFSGTLTISGGLTGIYHSGGSICVVAGNMVATMDFMVGVFEDAGALISSGDALVGKTAAQSAWLRCYSGGLLSNSVISDSGAILVSSGGTARGIDIAASTGSLFVYAGGTAVSVMCSQYNNIICYSGGSVESAIVPYGGRLDAQIATPGAHITVNECGGVVDIQNKPGVSYNSCTFELVQSAGDWLGVSSANYQRYERLVYSGGIYQRLLDSGLDFGYFTDDMTRVTASGSQIHVSLGAPVSTSGMTSVTVPVEPLDISIHSNTTLYNAIAPYMFSVAVPYAYGGCLSYADYIDSDTTLANTQVLKNTVVHNCADILIPSGDYYRLITKASAVTVAPGPVLPIDDVGLVVAPDATLTISSGGAAAGVVLAGLCGVITLPAAAITYGDADVLFYSGGHVVSSMPIIPNISSTTVEISGSTQTYYISANRDILIPEKHHINVDSITLGGGSVSGALYNCTWEGGSFHRMLLKSSASPLEVGFSGSFTVAGQARTVQWGEYLLSYADRELTASTTLVSSALSADLAGSITSCGSTLNALTTSLAAIGYEQPAALTISGALYSFSGVIAHVSSVCDLYYFNMDVAGSCIASSGDHAFVPSISSSLLRGSTLDTYMVPGYVISQGPGTYTGPGVVYSSGSYCYRTAGGLNGGMESIMNAALSSAGGYLEDCSGLLDSGYGGLNALIPGSSDGSAIYPVDSTLSQLAESAVTSVVYPLSETIDSLSVALATQRRFVSTVSTLLNNIVSCLPSGGVTGGHGEALIVESGAHVSFTPYSVYGSPGQLPPPTSDYPMFTLDSVVVHSGTSSVDLYVPAQAVSCAELDSTAIIYHTPTLAINTLFVGSGAIAVFSGTTLYAGSGAQQISSSYPQAGCVHNICVASGGSVNYGQAAISPYEYVDRLAYIGPQATITWANSSAVFSGHDDVNTLYNADLVVSDGVYTLSRTSITVSGLVISDVWVSSGGMLNLVSGGYLNGAAALSGGVILLQSGGSLGYGVASTGVLIANQGAVVSSALIYEDGNWASKHFDGSAWNSGWL